MFAYADSFVTNPVALYSVQLTRYFLKNLRLRFYMTVLTAKTQSVSNMQRDKMKSEIRAHSQWEDPWWGARLAVVDRKYFVKDFLRCHDAYYNPISRLSRLLSVSHASDMRKPRFSKHICSRRLERNADVGDLLFELKIHRNSLINFDTYIFGHGLEIDKAGLRPYANNIRQERMNQIKSTLSQIQTRCGEPFVQYLLNNDINTNPFHVLQPILSPKPAQQ